MKILLFGASGVLGREVAARIESHPELSDAEFATPSHKELSLLRVDLLAEALKAFRPNVLVNCAAITDVDRCEDSWKAEGVNSLRDVCKVAANFRNMHFVQVSTDYVFDGRQPQRRKVQRKDDYGNPMTTEHGNPVMETILVREPYTESSWAHPIQAYGRQKRTAEHNVMNNMRSYCILRTSMLIHEAHPNFAGAVIRAAKENKPIHGPTDQFGSPTCTRALADFIVDEAVVARRQGLFHVVNDPGVERSRFDTAKLLSRMLGRPEDPEAITLDDCAVYRAERPVYSVLGSDHGVSLGPLEDSLMKWLRDLRK